MHSLLKMIAIGLVVSSTGLVCCARQSIPKLKFAWNAGVDDSWMVQHSSTILVGIVRRLEYVGPVVDATDDDGYMGTWQLQRARVTVEHVFKGEALPSEVDIYFYMSLGAVAGAWNSLDLGERHIFYLVTENGTLRSVRDFWRSNLPVGSGRFPQHESAESGTLKERLVRYLLNPGDDFEPRRFRYSSVYAVPLSIKWLGLCKTKELVMPLVEHENPFARDVASEVFEYDLTICPENRGPFAF